MSNDPGDRPDETDEPAGHQAAGEHDTSALPVDRTSLREAPGLIARTFCMGSADVVPGVSGGTMALILGIYSRLIFAIRSLDTHFLRLLVSLEFRKAFTYLHIGFLLCLVAGIALAIVFFTRVIPLPVLIHTHPELIYGLFFGLIAGSILMLAYRLKRFGWMEAGLAAVGMLIGLRLVTLVPADTPETSLFVFFSGSVAVTAMVLPGISGSFILLILQQYDHIMGQFRLLGGEQTMDALLVLTPFALGMLAGLMLFTRLLAWLLKHRYMVTVCVLIGFMTGSLYVIWPFQEREYQEVVTVEQVPVTDERVEQLRQSPQQPGPPEYRELGEVVNPDADPGDRKIEVRHVRLRMMSSHPYLPQGPQDQRLQDGGMAFYGGLTAMLFGCLVVGMLMRLNHRLEP